jgi:hypothetical protein
MTQLSPLLNGLIERKKRILWVSWFGFLLSWVLYTFAAYLGTHITSQRPSQLNNTLLLGSVGFAILAGVFSLLIPRVIYNETKVRKMLKEIPKIEGLAKSRDGKIQGNLLNELKSLTIDEQRVYGIFAGYTGWYVVNGAIGDLIAVIGLFPAILGGDFELYFYFGIPALVLKVLHYPKAHAFLESIELIAQKGAVA